MPQENVELARKAYDAFNRRDWDTFLALMHDEVEAGSRQAGVEGAYHGHDGLRRWWGDLLDAFPDYVVQVVELRDLGDVTMGHLCGRAHSAHAPLADPFWQSIRWRGGKCVRWHNYLTEREALESVELKG
jgi:ketosteroid isomerase-like protein